ncbi:hypothetical protein TSOC_008264 [Tetrabaena socialis]|uniref:ApaG domain-containing protein n=1 Tax=Tetrabaena socialis TaxID=47790 RepID=A0A2J7ZYV1_9CHLO|nr:hypothetical protein TSOC_008264 [Tetrabaena socialis]|eukprot:PNH05449.1 hypothetical protein TSOC_008264 [Tetrabaena socialis]
MGRREVELSVRKPVPDSWGTYGYSETGLAYQATALGSLLGPSLRTFPGAELLDASSLRRILRENFKYHKGASAADEPRLTGEGPKQEEREEARGMDSGVWALAALDVVGGQQPVIPPGDCFEYVSGTDLDTPAGLQTGKLEIAVLEGGRPSRTFMAAVAPFAHLRPDMQRP